MITLFKWTNGRFAFSFFERMVAWRYLRARRKEGIASLIAAISFVGIMLGVASLIIVMSVMNGFREELLSRLLGVNGHIIVQPLDVPFENYQNLADRINALEDVTIAAPLIEGQVLIRSDKMQSNGGGALVRGVQGKDIARMKLISTNIKEGKIGDFDKSEGILIGQNIANTLNVFVGDKITLVSPDGDSTPMGVMPRVKGYTVSGIFEIGMSDYDGSIIYMPFKESQLYFNMENKAQFIEIYLKNPDKTESIKPKIHEIGGENIALSDWRERNESFFMALQIERNVMFIILSLIVLVAALNIISGLVMLVKEKGHDIAILRTMGATRGAILRIFLMTGAMIGISGTFAGFLLGYVICINIETIRQFFSWILGTVVFDPEYYLLSELPARINQWDAFSIVLMALILTFFSSLVPAWRASRLDPIEALRYE